MEEIKVGDLLYRNNLYYRVMVLYHDVVVIGKGRTNKKHALSKKSVAYDCWSVTSRQYLVKEKFLLVKS